MTDLRLTLQWVADAVGGRVIAGSPGQEVGRITTDTRRLQAGDFFVALRGERFDAHDFVGEAVERGATGLMVAADREGPRRIANGGAAGAADAATALTAREGISVVEVADTTKGLQDLAHAIRKASGTRVVAITGSAGKTTTKETIAEFLSTRFRVVKNQGNLNNHIGLPLSLMQLRERPDVAVMELGMNHAGEISALVAVAEPEVRVWTNVGDAHIGFFESTEAIADAKAEILENAHPSDVLVCNADDPLVRARAEGFVGRTLTFGTAEGATVRATSVEDLGLDGMRAHVTTPAGELEVRTPLLGRGNLANVLAATAVAVDFGVAVKEIAAAAARLQPADRRGAVRKLANGVTLIDDSYNSSPTALKRALDVLGKESRAIRKLAVLGEMLELGDHSIELHRQSGAAAAAAGLDVLFAIGGAPARALADAAVESGMPDDAVQHFSASDAAAAAIAAAVQPGDVILVKGSRGTRTDLIADRIAREQA
jgi:UDP-N-acetylmuramoyl-tripeptide--D-alanyl-D-alanine ligase